MPTIAEAKSMLTEGGYRLDVVKSGADITAARLLKDGADPVDLELKQAVALEVFVRQNGATPQVVAPETEPDWMTVLVAADRSKHLHSYRYNKATGLLEVTFRKDDKAGAVYTYDDVTLAEFEALHNADSLTGYLSGTLVAALKESGRKYRKIADAPAAEPITDVVTPLAQSIATEAAKLNPSSPPRPAAPQTSSGSVAGGRGAGGEGRPTTPTELRLFLFETHNYQRLEFFRHEFDLNDNLVLIGGENGNGKSSFQDGVEMLFTGPLRRVKRPIHAGADACRMKGVIGDAETKEPLYEIRRFKEGEDGWGFKIVRPGTNEKIPGLNQEAFLKDILGPITDPTEIPRMDPKDLRAYLIDVCGLHLDEAEKAIADAKEIVKDMEREKERLRAKFSDLPEHPDAPAEELTYGDLRTKLNAAIEHNRSLANLQSQKDRAEDAILAATSEIEDLENRLAAAKQRLHESTQAANEAGNKIKSFEPADEQAILAQIEGIEDTNKKVRDNIAKAAARKEAQECETKIGEAVAQWEAAKKAKNEALASAAFPIEGLGFSEEDGFVTFQGQPFAQASDAEKIRVSVALALARRGALPLLFVRNASLLDGKSLRLLADEAAKFGAQVLAEIVTNRSEEGHDRECTIYIHQGKVDEKGYRVGSGEAA